jgi:hypothetical protein
MVFGPGAGDRLTLQGIASGAVASGAFASGAIGPDGRGRDPRPRMARVRRAGPQPGGGILTVYGIASGQRGMGFGPGAGDGLTLQGIASGGFAFASPTRTGGRRGMPGDTTDIRRLPVRCGRGAAGRQPTPPDNNIASGRIILRTPLQGWIGPSPVQLPNVERWEWRRHAASSRRPGLAHGHEVVEMRARWRHACCHDGSPRPVLAGCRRLDDLAARQPMAGWHGRPYLL